MFLVSFRSSYRWNHHALARGPDPPSVIRSQCWPLWYWLMPPPWQLLQERDTKASSIGRCLAAERALRSLQGSFASLCHHLRPRRNEAACGCCCRSTSNEETTMVGAICTASFFSFSYVLLIRSFQKKFKQLQQPWRLNYLILALNESMKIFFGQLHRFSLFHWTCLASLRLSRYAS